MSDVLGLLQSKTKISLLLLTYFAIFISWAAYRLISKFPEPIDEFIFKPILWLGPVLIASRFQLMDIFKFKTNLNYVGLSVLVGIGLPALQIIPGFFTDQVRLVNPTFLIVTIPLATAFVEETVFRGFLLKRFTLHFPEMTADAITTILFTLIHLPLMIFVNKSNMSIILGYSYVLFISSYVYGLLYLRSKSLVPSIITHFLNNLLLALT